MSAQRPADSRAAVEAPAEEPAPLHDVRLDRVGFNGDRARLSCHGSACKAKPGTIVQQPYHRAETWEAAVEEFLSAHQTDLKDVKNEGWRA